MTDDMKKIINWEAIVAVVAIITIVGSNYLFTENAIGKFERRMEIMDERWYTVLNELHSQDKRILKLEIKK